MFTVSRNFRQLVQVLPSVKKMLLQHFYKTEPARRFLLYPIIFPKFPKKYFVHKKFILRKYIHLYI